MTNSRGIKMRLKKVLATIATTVVMTGLVGAVGASPAAADTPVGCNSDFTMYSNANKKAVSAELSYTGSVYGLLRARSSTVGPWEKFTLCKYTTYYTIKSNANGLYVSVELGMTGPYNGILRARSSAVGPWEKLTKTNIGNGWQFYFGSQANNKLVSVELGETYTGIAASLRARATSLGNWEVLG